MKRIRKRGKPVSVFLTVLVLSLVLPYQSVLGAMVGTETVIEQVRCQEARNYLNKLLVREDIRGVLVAQGIDPLEAKVRVDSLSDAEAVRVAKQIEELPAGSGAVEIFGIAVVVALIIMIILFVSGVLKLDNIW